MTFELFELNPLNDFQFHVFRISFVERECVLELATSGPESLKIGSLLTNAEFERLFDA